MTANHTTDVAECIHHAQRLMPMQPFHDRTALPTPIIAISGCLAGEPVRYDGDHKVQPVLLQTLQQHVHWVRVCPEVAAGFGVPRPPVQLRQGSHGGITVVDVANPGRDVTATLQHGVAESIRQLAASPPTAIVLKARSPSCGSGSTPLHDEKGFAISVTDGLFAAACRRQFPDVPLFDEAALASVQACQAFALLLLIRTDIEYVSAGQRQALDVHYRSFGIDTSAASTLVQQLAFWPAQRIAEAFSACWPNA